MGFDFEKALKRSAWTQAEIGVMIAGALASSRWIGDDVIFKQQFAESPEWFIGNRKGKNTKGDVAPFYIQWSGAIKSVGSLMAIDYYGNKMNPWLKLFLMGVALQGTLQQARILTYDDTKTGDDAYRVKTIGNKSTSALDAELKKLADEYRTGGIRYMGGGTDLGTRYETSVGRGRDLGTRYETSVARPFDFSDSDSSSVGRRRRRAA